MRRATAAPQGLGVQAEATVRRYLTALIAGNETAAYGALGARPGDPHFPLTEQAFVDGATRITSMKVDSVDATGAAVSAELRNARGSYVTTFHVRQGLDGLYIDSHDYIKI